MKNGLLRQAGQLLGGDALAADERLLPEPVQHLLRQHLGRLRLHPPQHPSKFIVRCHRLTGADQTGKAGGGEVGYGLLQQAPRSKL